MRNVRRAAYDGRIRARSARGARQDATGGGGVTIPFRPEMGDDEMMAALYGVVPDLAPEGVVPDRLPTIQELEAEGEAAIELEELHDDSDLAAGAAVKPSYGQEDSPPLNGVVDPSLVPEPAEPEPLDPETIQDLISAGASLYGADFPLLRVMQGMPEPDDTD